MNICNSTLGKSTDYIDHYQPNLLFPILRKTKRDEIHVPATLPFYGYDLWNAYEISWLNSKGKPMVAIGEIYFPITSAYLIESKSLKLYLNSFNQTQFSHWSEVENRIAIDLSAAVLASVRVSLHSLDDAPLQTIEKLSGICLDDCDVTIHRYTLSPKQLQVENSLFPISETLYSHLLKSNCLVTGQPDWGSVQIIYTGHKINHASLLSYLIGFRQHNEFHEQCVERIFMDILKQCQPTELTVLAHYTRRGGIDINPFRTTQSQFVVRNQRLVRQ